MSDDVLMGAHLTKYMPKFVFPENSTLNLFDLRFWSADNILQYLGRDVERGRPVTIWESEFDDILINGDGESRRGVVTRFYATDPSTNAVTGTPLKIVIKVRKLVVAKYERNVLSDRLRYFQAR